MVSKQWQKWSHHTTKGGTEKVKTLEYKRGVRGEREALGGLMEDGGETTLNVNVVKQEHVNRLLSGAYLPLDNLQPASASLNGLGF